MLEQSESPLKQKQGNMLNPTDSKNISSYNQKIRKVFFLLNFRFLNNRLNLIEEFLSVLNILIIQLKLLIIK